jgi:hypothetical protein
MRRKLVVVLFVIVSVGLFGFSTFKPEEKARTQIFQMYEGVLLIRLHTEDILLAKLKTLHFDKTRRKKVKEIEARNKSIYNAFTNGYSFNEVYFFYRRDSEKVRKGEFDGVFLDENLSPDNSIKLDSNKPIFVLEVGDIYFEHMAGHIEGVAVLNDQLKQLEKPFPFYVKKRSGFAILKRSDLDLAVLLDKKLKNYYNIQKSKTAEK